MDWNEQWDNSYKVKNKKEDQTLVHWIKQYSAEAKIRSKLCWPVREEISRLQNKLCKELELKDLIWDCGWGTSHFRGCLQSFQTLVTHHSNEMKTLRGRTVIFGSESGVSLQG